jgi:glycosyltransferase involved in cell wall biosynthesis
MAKFARRRRLLTIGHSYCVDVNRRFAHALARHGDWDVTVVGPAHFLGDFRPHTLRPDPGEPCAVIPVPVYFSRRVHTMLYGRPLMELLKESWDLVHCWEEPYVAAAAQVAYAASSGVPLVFATFQNITKRYPPPFNWIERYAMARADGVIAFGQTVFDVVSPRAPRDVPIRVIPPGVDVEHFAPDAHARSRMFANYGWSDGPPVVGFLGRLVPEKGCLFLAAVLDQLSVDWRAVFIGSGPLESDLRRWSLRHGDRVRIETRVPHGEVPKYLAGMDVLCAPSQTTAAWREQFGRMLIEAFAAGVPVLASDSGEIPHVVGNAGMVVSESDRAAWGQALSGLLADPARRADFAERGRKRAASAFSWPVVARQHAEFFDHVIDSRQRATRGLAATLASGAAGRAYAPSSRDEAGS